MTPVEIAIAILMALGVAAIIVAVVGMAFSSEVFAMLLYGSIPSGFAAAAIVLAAGLSLGTGIAALQLFGLFVALAVSGAVAGHRIAAAAAARDRRRAAARTTYRRSRLALILDRLPLLKASR